MRMVLTDNVTDHAGRFLVRLVEVIAKHTHCVQDTPVNRLQTIANVRQCTPDNDTHRVVQIGLLHLVFETYSQQFLCNFSHIFLLFQLTI